MKPALRLVDPSVTPTLSPASLAAPRSSMCPTLVPRACVSQRPAGSESLGTMPPLTQRSATLYPRGSAPTQLETYNLLAVMRLNLDFLESLLASGAPAAALEAFDDLHRTIDRLERRCATTLAGPAPIPATLLPLAG